MSVAITWAALTPEQQSIMRIGQSGHAFTIGDWEEERRRQADELVRAGLLTDGGVDRFNYHQRTYSVTIAGRTLMQQGLPTAVSNTGMSSFSLAQQLRINAALVTHFYDRTRRLMIELEQAKGVRDEYGTTIMNAEDRMFNRIMAAVVVSDLGIPAHDTESLEWLASVLGSVS